jgi:hypothetical protein
MAHRIVCDSCGRDLSGTEGPCPNCGSTARHHALDLESVVEVGDAVSLSVHRAATAVVGPSPPQPSTKAEDIAVLALLVGDMGVGFAVGHAIGGLPGGAIGGVAGGAITVGTLRWRSAREATFRFIRSLTGD